GERVRLTGVAWKKYVHQLRYTHQAVMVGSGTVLVDDPQLTIDRRNRSVPFRRVIVAGRRPINPAAKIFSSKKGYLPTIVLFPESAGKSSWVARLGEVGETLSCPDQDGKLFLAEALRLLRNSFGIVSVLCEGGPLLAKKLLLEDQVETIYWAQAPRLLSSPRSVATISPDAGDLSNLNFMLSGVRNLKGDVASEYWRYRSENV
ncbi:MAG: RibD family protein, partial [Candidatus Eremiobacteraeota bacterium]|nr:RibD family protein [Candidatus Eremiobacteraeota bacterium]